MTSGEELKLYAQKYRWAFDELVVDQKMQEANHLCSQKSVQPMYEYLVKQMGGSLAVLGALRWIVQKQKRRLKSLSM